MVQIANNEMPRRVDLPQSESEMYALSERKRNKTIQFGTLELPEGKVVFLEEFNRRFIDNISYSRTVNVEDFIKILFSELSNINEVELNSEDILFVLNCILWTLETAEFDKYSDGFGDIVYRPFVELRELAEGIKTTLNHYAKSNGVQVIGRQDYLRFAADKMYQCLQSKQIMSLEAAA